MLFHDPGCRAEVTLRENNAKGMYALCCLDLVLICIKRESGGVYVDGRLSVTGADFGPAEQFLAEYGPAFTYNEKIEAYRCGDGYFYKICIRQDTHYFVFSVYYRKGAPVSPDSLSWLHITTQLKYAYTLLNNESIQERELSERIIDSIDATILVMDLNGRLVSTHGDLCAAFGTRFSNLFDPNFQAGMSPYSWKILSAAFREVMEAGEKRQLNHLVFYVEGRERMVNMTLSPLRDSKENLAGTVLVCSDVTELWYMEHELQLTKQFGMLGQIAAGLAHDVKNPLMNISGCVRALMKNAVLPQEHMELLSIVLHECQRINTVIEQMLSFGKVPATSRRASLDLNGLLRNCIGIISRQRSVKRIDVVADLEPRLPLVSGDESGLQQAFLNILVNGVEAIADSGRIAVRSRLTERGDIQVEIEDDGCGIPEADLKKLFTPYYSTKDSGGSSGLGLFLAKRFFDQNRASIVLTSKQGEGTLVTVTLPGAETHFPQNASTN